MAGISSLSEALTDFSKKTKRIREPTPSVTSLKFLTVDQDLESDTETIHETFVATDKLSRGMKTYELMRVIQTLLCGDLTATVTQLNLLYDMELDNMFVQKVFFENAGVEILVNLLEVRDHRCHFGALKCIEKMASNNNMRLILVNLGIMPLLVHHLISAGLDIRILIAKSLTQLCKVQKGARFFRKEGGITLLVDALDIDESTLNTATELLTVRQRDEVTLATAATATLKTLAKYPKSVNVIYKSGFVLVMKKTTHSCHLTLLIEIFELLSICAKKEEIRGAIETEGVFVPCLRGLLEGDEQLRASCAATVAECATDSELTRHIVRLLRGLRQIVDLTANTKQQQHTVAVLTLTVAKLAQDNRNLRIMSDRGLTFNLMKYLQMEVRDEEIISNVLEGLAECARIAENRESIAQAGLVDAVVRRLMGDEPRLLTTAAMCLGTLARTKEVAQEITERDGMRLLFSKLNDKNPGVVATAAWALRPLIMNTTDSAEEVRCIVGGIGILIHLLSVGDHDIVAQACGLIAEISSDEENLQILSDRGIVQALSERINDKKEDIQLRLAEAIASAATLRKNAKEFGMRGVVPILRNFLSTKRVMLHIYVMEALASLTEVPFNCILLHECDGVGAVMSDVAAPYKELQILATRVLRNMRHVALSAEMKAGDECRFTYIARNVKPKKERLVMDVSNQRRATKDFYSNLRRKFQTPEHFGLGFADRPGPVMLSARR